MLNPADGPVCPDCCTSLLAGVRQSSSLLDPLGVCSSCENVGVPDGALTRCLSCSAELCTSCTDIFNGFCPDCFEVVNGEELVAVLYPPTRASGCAHWVRVPAPQAVCSRRVYKVRRPDE